MDFTHNAFIFIFMTTVQNQNFSHNRLITFGKFISNYLQDFSLSVFHNSTLHPDSPMFLNLSHNVINISNYLQDFSLSVFHNSTLHPDSPLFLNLSHNAIR